MQANDGICPETTDRELLHQNHELKKKLIRIEYEAKRERSMMLQQFEQMKAKMMDMDTKERFIKNSQASLNELISNINPVKDKYSAGLLEDENKSLFTNPYTIQLRNSPTNQRVQSPLAMANFGIDQKSSLQRMIAEFENRKDIHSSSTFQAFSMYGASPTKIQRSASSHISKSPQVEKIRVSPKYSPVEEEPAKLSETIQDQTEQSPEFRKNLATSSDFTGFDFGVNSQEDRRETRDFTPVRMFNGPGMMDRENLMTDGSRNSPKSMVRIDHSSPSKESRSITPMKSAIQRQQAQNPATPVIRDFIKEDDSKSIDIVSTTMQKMPDKEKITKGKQRIFYNKPSEKPQNQKTPIRDSKFSDVPSRDMTPDHSAMSKSILNINSINIDFVRGKIGIQVNPNQQSNLLSLFKKSTVAASSVRNSPSPSSRSKKEHQKVSEVSSPFLDKAINSDIFSLKGESCTRKHTPRKNQIIANYVSNSSSRSGISADFRRDIDCSIVTVRKRNINISDCGSDNLFSARGEKINSSRILGNRSRSPMGSHSKLVKPIARPIDPPLKQSLLRLKKRPVPTIEKQLRPPIKSIMANHAYTTLQTIMPRSRHISRENEYRGLNSSRIEYR